MLTHLFHSHHSSLPRPQCDPLARIWASSWVAGLAGPGLSCLFLGPAFESLLRLLLLLRLTSLPTPSVTCRLSSIARRPSWRESTPFNLAQADRIGAQLAQHRKLQPRQRRRSASTLLLTLMPPRQSRIQLACLMPAVCTAGGDPTALTAIVFHATISTIHLPPSVIHPQPVYFYLPYLSQCHRPRVSLSFPSPISVVSFEGRAAYLRLAGYGLEKTLFLKYLDPLPPSLPTCSWSSQH
ncbi:hypothetical protein F4780DRAFT_413261 [Xylariomycetidae sp. FL0641]|nr:hypothetical protein F4780DRAFT_413261 [Xylariomycetidae sp. FL0641]